MAPSLSLSLSFKVRVAKMAITWRSIIKLNTACTLFFLLPFTFTSVAARISYFLTAAIKKTLRFVVVISSNNPIGHAIYRQNACVLEMQNFTRMKGGTTDVRMHYSVRTKIYWMYR